MNKSKNKVVAIVGLCGSGKSIAAEFFRKKGYKYIRFGQRVLDKVKKKIGEKSDPKLEKEIREDLREKYGMGAFAVLNKKNIDKFLKKGNVVIDGLYSWSEYKILKKEYGNNFKVIAVNSSPEIRYDRLTKRKIDAKMINRPMFREDAMKRDISEIENIEKGGPIALADETIINNNSMEKFIEELELLFRKKKFDRISWDDYFMKMAFLVAERSTCLRRHVGSVIVKNKRVLSTGYNGSVKGAKHCQELGCLRDELNIPSGKDKHICRSAHAEQNALIQSAVHGVNLLGSTIYITHNTCSVCAKMIINAGIKKVVSCTLRKENEFEKLFKETGVEFVGMKKPSTSIEVLDYRSN